MPQERPKKWQKDKKGGGGSTVMQWIRNPTAAAWVTVEAWILSPGKMLCEYKIKSFILFFGFFLFVFLPFLGPLLRHMEVPRLGVESEL